jgi:hypothetical protein
MQIEKKFNKLSNKKLLFCLPNRNYFLFNPVLKNFIINQEPLIFSIISTININPLFHFIELTNSIKLFAPSSVS